MDYYFPVSLPRFEYMTPRTLAEACSLLAADGQETAVLAGGTDLIADLRRHRKTPKKLLSLREIAGLDAIETTDESKLVLGPRVTIGQVQTSPLVRETLPLLAEMAGVFGNRQVRNLATVAGNLCTASCAADTIAPLMALEAEAKLMSAEGERMVSIERLCQTPFKPALRQDELLASVVVPRVSLTSVGAYLKYSIPGSRGRAFVGAAVLLDMDGNLCRQARIAVAFSSHCWLREGCLYECPSPARFPEAEAQLEGTELGDDAIQAAAQTAASNAYPFVNTDYTREMILVHTRRALIQAREKAMLKETSP
ncbi:MAG: FAD binding domain-containing protein [Dehalococcoidia bacterium]